VAHISSSAVRLVSAYCPDYPPELCDLADAPCVFRVKGDLPSFARAVSIVGTRRADDEALDFAYDLARHAALRGVVVVSGGAMGVDRAAHEGALDGGGRSVAVLPTGLDPPYPASHGSLFERIAGSGCLVTEVADGTSAQKGRFLTRNRLVAALGASTVVVQAPARSGALSTARIAKRLGRRVFAVPASPWDPRGSGALGLLRAGARICAEPADVLSDFASPGGDSAASRPGKQREPSDFSDLSQLEQSILRHLGGRARHADELCQRTGIPAFQVQQSILQLLVRGLIEERPGGRYQSCRAGRKPY
jgi:DNA processing protein